MRKLFVSILLALFIAGPMAGRGEMTTHITTLAGLQNMNLNLAEDYILDNDIDATATSGWNAGLGFDPIGDPLAVNFSGSFNGQGYTISNLYINRPDEYAGLFGGAVTGVVLRNVTLANVDIRGGSDALGYSIAGLVALYGSHAAVPSGVISNVHVTGNVRGGATGTCYAGGVGGAIMRAAVSNCTFEGTVAGNWDTGGLIGRIIYCSIFQCSAIADATLVGPFGCGGLVGMAYGGSTFSQCCSRGSIGGNGSILGGLVGQLSDAIVANSSIANCYSLASVGGVAVESGGLVGRVRTNTTVDRSYSAGPVTTVGGFVGGLIGFNNLAGEANVTLSFWDTETSGQAASDGGTGRTTVQMNTEATFTAATWDFATIWNICSPPTPEYPWLQWEGVVCSGGVTICLIG